MVCYCTEGWWESLENGNSSPENRTVSSFTYKSEVPCVARGAERGLSIPSKRGEQWYHEVTQPHLPLVYFSPNSKHLWKIPFLSCSPLHSEPKTDLKHGRHTKAQWSLHLCGGEEHLGFYRAWAPEITHGTWEISSCLCRLLGWNPLLFKRKHSKQTRLYFVSFALWLNYCIPTESFSIFIATAGISATVFWAWGPKYHL